MEKLWKFKYETWRSGSLSGLFIATQEQVDNLIDKTANFGEALGKHSEVIVQLKNNHFTSIPVLDSTIKDMKNHIGASISGYNPLDYISTTCDHCGDSMSPDEWDCIYREDLDEIVCYECYIEFKKHEL